MLNQWEAELAGLISASIRFMQNVGRDDPHILASVAVQVARDHGWELTNGYVAMTISQYKQELAEAQTEIMYLRAQLQEIECLSPR